MRPCKIYSIILISALVSLIFLLSNPNNSFSANRESDLWGLAQKYEPTFRFSTLFTAQAVRNHFKTEADIQKTIQWCKETAITRVFIETYRDGYTAEKEDILRGKKMFLESGIKVSGCVTPTRMGVASNGWNVVSNYEMQETRDECKRIFEYTASLFDEIMIDDFLFTDDASETSVKARGDRSWSEYRCDLMLQISREFIINPARNVNPNVKIIIKYPQWYDLFHERGYNVETQTDLFDRIWVGTETRDPDSEQWGRKAQYEAFYIMQWLTDVGGEKTGGGWFDALGTGAETYVEQARQTILGGAKEAMLFNYQDLIRERNIPLIKALRNETPALFKLADAVKNAKPIGVLAPKIPNSDANGEKYIYDFLDMLGLPLAPLSRIEASFQSALFARQSWRGDDSAKQIEDFIAKKKSAAITHNLKETLEENHLQIPKTSTTIHIPNDPRDLYNLPQNELKAIREFLLKPLNLEIEGPSRIAIYLYDNGLLAVENFRDKNAQFTVRLSKPLTDEEQNQCLNESLAFPKASSVRVRAEAQILRFELERRSMGVIKLPSQYFETR